MSFVDFFGGEQLQNFLRPTLSQQLDDAIQEKKWSRASALLAAFIDTWPIGGSIVQAWHRWNHECDPLALTMLARGNEIISLVGGTPLKIPVVRDLPPYISLLGEEVVERRAELCAKALKKEIWGIVCTTPLPLDVPSQLAMGEIRMEAHAQDALERFGLVGLLAPNAPQWSQCLGKAPQGRMGENLHLMCDLALLPSTPKRIEKGELQVTAWMLWNGPAQPVPVHKAVYVMLKNISKGPQEAFAAAGVSQEQGSVMLNELIAMGALGHMS